MMDASQLQQEFFKMIKSSMPPGSSAIDEIAQVLNVSVDSVYRRMRGEAAGATRYACQRALGALGGC